MAPSLNPEAPSSGIVNNRLYRNASVSNIAPALIAMPDDYSIVQKKILKTNIRLSELKYQLNSRLPVFRLSNEILGLILTFCVQLSYLWSDKPRCLLVSHVCRHWRQVALNCPAIWSTPEFRFPILAREMVKRAKCAPLSFVGSIQKRHQSRSNVTVTDSAVVLSEVFDIARIAIIEITTEQQVFLDLSPRLTQTAPLLQTFEWKIMSGNACAHLPDNFLDGHAPRLRVLILNSLHLKVWDSPLLNNLTTLVVAMPACKHHACVPSVAQIAAALKRTPNLQVLKLQSKESLSQSDELVRGSGPPDVHLHHLRHLELHLPISDCTGLMDHLVVSSSAYIHVTCVVQKSSSYDPLLSSLLRIFNSTCANETSREIEHLALRSNSRSFSLRVGKVRDSIWALPYIDTRMPYFYFDLISKSKSGAVPDTIDFVQRLVEALPLVNTRSISLGLNTTNHLFRHLALLPHLHEFEMSGDCAYHFMDVFSAVPSPLPFPALDKLALTSVDFSPPTCSSKVAFFNSLFAGLWLRFKNGKKLSRLSLYECSHVRGFVGEGSKGRLRLEGVVGELHWDEEEMTDARHQPPQIRDPNDRNAYRKSAQCTCATSSCYYADGEGCLCLCHFPPDLMWRMYPQY